MSNFVVGLETHQFLAYREEAINKAQISRSALEGTAMIIPLVGKMTSLDAYGEAEWYSREEAGEEMKVTEIERDRRWIASEHFAVVHRWEKTEDHTNLHRFEPNGNTMFNDNAAWERKKDSVFWGAFAADVAYGEKGNKLAVLPASQKVDVTVKEIDITSTSGATAEGATGDVVIEGSTASGVGSIDATVVVGLNLGKIRHAQNLLLDQEVDAPLVVATTHRQINDMLNSSRFTELDNQTMNDLGRLGERTGNVFLGMTWNRVGIRQAPTHAANRRYAYMYTDRAMVGGKVNGSLDVRLDELPEKHHKRQLAMYADYGVVRRIDEEVIQIDCKDG